MILVSEVKQITGDWWKDIYYWLAVAHDIVRVEFKNVAYVCYILIP